MIGIKESIKIPDQVVMILNKIVFAGYDAHIVGGACRDIYLGREPKDYDITTSALPEEIIALFPAEKVSCVGIKHGSVIVTVDGVSVDVTTYRTDAVYTDGRHPDEVVFTKSLLEDLERRDFTINTLVMNSSGNIYSFVGGIPDLDKGLIRAVGDSRMRFDEDRLRVLRGLRFALSLGFNLAAETKFALTDYIFKMPEPLKGVSAERVGDELIKTLRNMVWVPYGTVARAQDLNNFRMLSKLVLNYCKLGLGDAFCNTPQKNPHHKHDVCDHTYYVCASLPDDAEDVLLLAAFCHDLGKTITNETDANGVDHFPNHGLVSEMYCNTVLTTLKFSTDIITRVCKLVQAHDNCVGSVRAARRFLQRYGSEDIESFLRLRKADLDGHSDYQIEEKRVVQKEMAGYFHEVFATDAAFSLKQLAINGHDVINCGFVGRDVGLMLDFCLGLVIDEVVVNDADTLVRLISSDNPVISRYRIVK